MTVSKARIFLLVDLREFPFRFRVAGTKKKKSSETGHFRPFFFLFFSF